MVTPRIQVKMTYRMKIQFFRTWNEKANRFQHSFDTTFKCEANWKKVNGFLFRTCFFLFPRNTITSISHPVLMIFHRLNQMAQHSRGSNFPWNNRTAIDRSGLLGTKHTLGWRILRVLMRLSALPAAISVVWVLMLEKPSSVGDSRITGRLKKRKGSSRSFVRQTTMWKEWLRGRHSKLIKRLFIS